MRDWCYWQYQGSRKTGGYVLIEKGQAFVVSMKD